MAKVTQAQKETAEIMFQLQQQAALKDIRSEVDEELAELLSMLCAQGRINVFDLRTGQSVQPSHVTMNGPCFQINVQEDCEIVAEMSEPKSDKNTFNA